LFFKSDIGIDLGTSSVLVYVKGKGVVLQEPSVVAIDRDTNKVIAVGEEARKMLGRTPGNIIAIRPLKEGVISDYEVTQIMLKHFIEKAAGKSLIRPRIVVCVPSGVTEVEKRAVLQATTQAGARKAYIIEEPVAAAIGAGIDIKEAKGHMIIDIGGGTTDVAVISLGGIVVSKSIKVAGDTFDESIIKFVRKKYNVIIGERSAEKLKIEIGTAYPREKEKITEIRGRCVMSGLPRLIRLNTSEMLDALEAPIKTIVEAVQTVLENTPPELSSDISDEGIVMTGGGSLLHGLDRLIEEKTGIAVRIADEPMSCVAIGTGHSLDNILMLEKQL
jgi:rod shape-determining protein MreB and related proteins